MPKKFEPILEKVLARITPSREERRRVLVKVQGFLKALNAQLKKHRIAAKAVLGGSYAKDTWLAGDYDVDVFVRFALKHKNDDLSGMLGKALKPFKPTRIHGSRDYFWVREGKGKLKITYELVPVLAITKPSQAENVTDFSPWHVDWVNKKGKKRQNNDIRLVKTFMKAQRCYGAESYVRGFSGHVVDILTIHYRGFLPLLKAAAKWKTQAKVVVDVPRAHKGKALLVLNRSKTEGPVVLVDPVQPLRNAAAALAEENLARFTSAAKAFLKKPSEAFFEPKPIDFAAMKKKGKGLLVFVRAQTLARKEDVAGAKMVRAFEFLRDNLAEFSMIDAGWEWDKKRNARFWFLLGKPLLPAIEERRGPPLRFKDDVKRFKRGHKRTFTRKGKIWAREKRRYPTPAKKLSALLKEEYVQQRVRKPKMSRG